MTFDFNFLSHSSRLAWLYRIPRHRHPGTEHWLFIFAMVQRYATMQIYRVPIPSTRCPFAHKLNISKALSLSPDAVPVTRNPLRTGRVRIHREISRVSERTRFSDIHAVPTIVLGNRCCSYASPYHSAPVLTKPGSCLINALHLARPQLLSHGGGVGPNRRLHV